jgi:hypothetical protein
LVCFVFVYDEQNPLQTTRNLILRFIKKDRIDYICVGNTSFYRYSSFLVNGIDGDNI